MGACNRVSPGGEYDNLEVGVDDAAEEKGNVAAREKKTRISFNASQCSEKEFDRCRIRRGPGGNR